MLRHPTMRRSVAVCLIALLSGGQTAPAWGGDWGAQLRARWDNHKGIPSAEALALEIQKLEKHIDYYGTIVAKQPDVWGQSRLMKYRQEFEDQMKTQISLKDNFLPSIQGSINRSDQVFLSEALALSAAASGAPAVQLPQTASISQSIASRQAAATKAGLTATPTPINLVDANSKLPNLIDDTGNKPIIARTPPADNKTPTGFGPSTLTLEQTEYVDQASNYLNHLNEIRRINAGDDTSVSPGYALHLVRMPVSILPGSKTRKGYGAEITVTATPYLGRDLLPVTFRNLVVNDLMQQLSTPFTEYFNSPSLRSKFEVHRKALLDANDPSIPLIPMSSNARPANILAKASASPTTRPNRSPNPPGSPVRSDSALLRTSLKAQAPNQSNVEVLTPYKARYLQSVRNSKNRSEGVGQVGHPLNTANSDPANVNNLVAGDISTVVARAFSPGTRSRNARFAFPATQMNEVYGPEFILPVTLQTYDVLLERTFQDTNEPLILQYQKVAGHLQDQLAAAYDFLSRPENAYLWINHATPELAHAIQARDTAAVKMLRKAFTSAIPSAIDQDSRYCPKAPEDLYDFPWYTTTAAYSWAILVESVLLNERLIEDVKESTSAKGGPMLAAEHMPFFLPCPPDEARDAFNAYVKNRFPIHVFALDPVIAEQNIADQLSRSRELQFALSLAFVTGNLSVNSLTNFARRIEEQTSTIALNRSQIAFSHGDDTFGWRFQPRYQTPPIQNNLAAISQVIGGGPTREGDRRQLELEAGQRECTAIVIMPSFVPYVSFETRTNWYRLNSPKHADIDAIKFLELSASIKRAFTLAQAVCDAGMYRDGEIGRLVNRVKQLSAELPFQSMIQQVPYENTHGGFELFNSGISDLAPELRSWYGAPGVNIDNGGTLFLVGNNFSVHETSVIVGNKPLISNTDDLTTLGYQLLSRQVMKVVIPGGCQVVMRGGNPYVEASIATPYGVSQPLYIPVYPGSPPKAPAPTPAPTNAPTFAWKPQNLTLGYKSEGVSNFVQDLGKTSVFPAKGLSITLDSRIDLTDTKADLTLSFAPPYETIDPVKVAGVPYIAGAFRISDKNYTEMIADIFDRFGDSFGGPKSKPPVSVTVARTVISLKGVKGIDGPVVPEDVSNTLTIDWMKVSGSADSKALGGANLTPPPPPVPATNVTSPALPDPTAPPKN